MTVPSNRAPYDLRDRGGDSQRFCRQVERLADRTSADIERRAGSVLRQYAAFVSEVAGEAPRSRQEYGVELLTLGLVRFRYAGAAERTPRLVVKLAALLHRARLRFARWRRAIDPVRGALLWLYFVPGLRGSDTLAPCTLRALDTLLAWLAATGEFKEESLRLQSWRAFLASLPESRRSPIIGLADELFAAFRKAADGAFREYTRSLTAYQAAHAGDHRLREDALLVTKTAEEYHLNFLASELMNRGLRAEYERTTRRVALVPGCMRTRRSGECQAITRGTDILCAGCDPTCHVHVLQEQGRRDGFRVRIVPHATSFTRWLERYQAEASTGIIPVACPLHLAAGGYEVRRLGLKAQCVLLDYCGCQKHWHPAGIPTSTNPDRVAQMARAGRIKSA